MFPIRLRRFEMRFLYGHSMAPREIPRFRDTLRFLRRHFEFVSNADALQLVRDSRPPDGHYLAFSFDDGFRDNFDLIAPTLDEVGARACFFLISNFIECDDAYRRQIIGMRLRCGMDRMPMTWSMVRHLASAGFEIGAHTADHFSLDTLPLTEAERQIRECKRAIEARCSAPCRLFAWPYGTAKHFPRELLAVATNEFDATFSAIRTRQLFSFDSTVINRDHFEPSWPTSHVRFFVRARSVRPAVSQSLHDD